MEWEPISFTETELKIQLNFVKPGEISQGADKNEIEVYVWNTALFVR